MFVSAHEYQPPILPTTKAKQRIVVKKCVRTLEADKYIRENYPELILDLAHVYNQLHNRKSKRAPRAAASVTPEIAAKVQQLYYEHPDWTMHDIGLVFNLQEARVSEIVHGRRT